MPAEDWPFHEPPSAVSTTTRSVVERLAPILLVQHMAEDAGWAFLDGGAFDMDEALLVVMRRLVDLDPTVRELSDLPAGWLARRDHAGGPWRREQDEA